MRAATRPAGRKGLRQHWTSILLVLLLAVPLAIAAVHEGFPSADVEMGSRDVWVTNAKDERAGRLNAQISEIDASVSLDSGGLDVVQDGEDVFVHDDGGGTVGRVDPIYTDLRERIAVPGGSQIAYGGDTLAILEEATGKLWLLDAAQPLTFDANAGDPVLTLGPGAQVAVTPEGAALAYSQKDGELFRIPAIGADPVSVKMGDGDAGGDVELAAVGERAAILDRDSNRVLLEDDVVVGLDAVGVRLQASGPERDSVLVATAADFIEVPLSGGAPEHISWPGAEGTATDELSVARPVVVEGCRYGAWASTDQVVTACGSGDPVVTPLPARDEAGELIFRVNRDIVALNDVATGNVWMPQDDLRFVENWEDTVPPEDTEGDDGDQEATEQSFEDTLAERTEENHPPELVDDEFGARPGATAYLPVLDNDTDPDGDLITITELSSDLPASVGTLRVIDDGRALQLDAAEGAAGEFTITYTGTDGRPNGVAQARIAIRIVPAAEENRGPEQRHKATVTVEAGQLVRYNVLPDWQDPEGDPVYLLNAVAPGGSNVTTSPDGVLTFEALGAELGDRLVTYTVSDGTTETTGELTVQVGAPGSLAPVATPDFARGYLGAPVEAEPLLNDIAPSGGALQIIEVVELDGAGGRASFNPDLGTVSLEAMAPGAYYVQYTVSSGSADTKGIIRFEVVDPAEEAGEMIAVRDTAFLRPGQPATVSPLLNDEVGGPGVLSVQSVTTTDEARISGLSIELIDNATVRVSTQNAITEPIELPYTITDGAATAEGIIVVLPVEPPSEHHPPLALDDARSVRVGDYATVDVLANDIHPDGTPMRLEPELVDLQIDGGYAFVSDGKVRIQAPSEPGTYWLGYRITDEYGEQSGARVIFDVGAMDEASNRPPAPSAEVARVFEGSTIRVNIPLSGVDPDGDSVTLQGITGLPSLGSIREQDETSFVYEAFPGSQGTDEVSYEVVDTYGARGVGTIRIGVVPRPAETAPPVAVDDLVDAQPGRIVSVPVLENDSDPNGYPIELVDDLSEADPALGAEIDGSAIMVQVPDGASFFSVPYSITNGHGGTDRAYVHVTVTPDAPVPAPTAQDHVVPAAAFDGVDFVDVPLREGAWNPSGRTAELGVAAAGVNAASAEITEDGSLRVRPTDRRQIFAYELADPITEQTAAAFVLVPALQVTEESKRQSPYLRTDLPAQITNVSTPIRWNVNDLVAAPSGLPVHVIDAPSAWAEQGDGSPVVVDEQTIQFVPKPGFRGPASVTFLVSDSQGSEDEALAGVATIRVPLTVGDPNMYDVAPTFVAPQLTVPVGTSQTLDLATATGHPNPDVIPQVQFSGLTGGSEGVTASLSGSVLTVEASRQTRVGEVLRLGVTYAFRDFVQTGTINVTVTSSPLPPPRVVDDEGLGLRGQASRVDVLANDFNPYPDTPLTITRAEEVSASSTGSTVTIDGGEIVVEPGRTFVGEVTVQYTVIDDTKDTTRTASGYLRVRFRDVPDAPPAVNATTEGDGSVVVRWDAPQSNGEPLIDYEVYLEQSGSATILRPSGPVTGNSITFTAAMGVIKGQTYTATVRARNSIGLGGATQSNSVKPITRPGAPTNVDVSDALTHPGQTFGLLTVSWSPPADTGGEIVHYRVDIVSPQGATNNYGDSVIIVPPSGDGRHEVTVPLTITGGSRDYGFTVTAVNANGEATSPTATGTLTYQHKPELSLQGGQEVAPRKPDPKYDSIRYFEIRGRDFENSALYTVVCTEGTSGRGFPEHEIARIVVYGSWLNSGSWNTIAECVSDQPGYRVDVYDQRFENGVSAVATAEIKRW